MASRGGRPSLNSNELDQDIQENKMAEDRVAPQEMELTLVNHMNAIRSWSPPTPPSNASAR